MSDNLTEKLSDNGHMNELLRLVRGIDARLQSLEKQVEERLYDTRPIWENVQEQLGQIVGVQHHQGEILTQYGEILTRYGEILTQHGEILRRYEDRFNHLEERITHLEDRINRLQAEMEKGFRQIGRQMDTLAGNYVRLDASLRDLEDRFKNTEPRVS